VTGSERWRGARAAIAERATPRVVLAVGYAVFLIYAYPGYMTAEAADQLIDARAGSFTDWHSPAMSELWRLVEWGVAGPFGMLVVQSGLVLGGAYHLLRRAMSPRAAAVAAAAVLLFPPVLAPIAAIWRDGQMAGFLLAGAAAVTSPRRGVRIAGLGLVLVACAMRDAAAFAALPLVVVGFAWRDGQRRWTRYPIAVAAWAVIAIAAVGLDAALTDAVSERPQLALAASDIVGVLRYAGPIGDAELARDLAGTRLVAQHDIQAHARRLHDGAGVMAGPDRLFDAPETPGDRAAVLAARRALAWHHRGAYLAARWHMFYRTLGLSRATRARPVYTSFLFIPDHRAATGHAATHGWIQDRLTRAVQYLGRRFLFHPYLYFVVALVLLPLAVVRRQRDAAMLLASGLAGELSLSVLADAPDRSSHWMIVCTVLGIVIMIARRITARS